MEKEKILLTPVQAQKILGVGRNRIYELLETKGFPSFKIGERYYVNREQLQEWANSQCQKKK